MLFGAGLLIVTTVLGVGILQRNKHFAVTPEVAAAAPVETRSLRFVDAGDGVSVYGGHVSVYDGATGAELPQLRENDGFIRAVLNSLMFERTKRGVSGVPVFELAAWPDGKVTLGDPTTGARISLGAFGSGNKSVFMRFLERSAAQS
jgi:putative photosynthetic complex assembly protein